MSNISLDKETFYRRMKKLYAAWKVGNSSSTDLTVFEGPLYSNCMFYRLLQQIQRAMMPWRRSIAWFHALEWTKTRFTASQQRYRFARVLLLSMCLKRDNYMSCAIYVLNLLLFRLKERLCLVFNRLTWYKPYFQPIIVPTTYQIVFLTSKINVNTYRKSSCLK